jgi:hypothetical protein
MPATENQHCSKGLKMKKPSCQSIKNNSNQPGIIAITKKQQK